MNGDYSVKVEEHSRLAAVEADERREELTASAAANILSANNGLGNVKHSKENRYEDYTTKQNHPLCQKHKNAARFCSKNKTSNAGLEKNFTKSLPSEIVAGSPPNNNNYYNQNRHRRTIAQRTISSGESIFKKLINSATSAYNKSLAATTTQAELAATVAATSNAVFSTSTSTSTPEKQQMMNNQISGVGPPSAQYGLVTAPLSALGAATTVSGGGDTSSAGPLKGNRDSIKADFSSDSLDFKTYRRKICRSAAIAPGCKYILNPMLRIHLKVVEEKIRRRIFVHYDCVSVCASTQPLMSGTSRLDESILNAATGASRASRPNKAGTAAAATVASSSSPMNSSKSSSWHTLNDEFGADDDDGDGKSNAIVTSCAFFRNEVGGEPSRAVSLNRAASSQQQQATIDRKIDEKRETWLRPSTAAEASIMENLSNVYFGGRLCAGRQDHMVFEYVDQGAFYYRHCFAGKAVKLLTSKSEANSRKKFPWIKYNRSKLALEASPSHSCT
uniref:Uncharacterized protein n=1 Tax=Romanomermis culicivorax TaxID=13658 RepID=A0A915JMV9_ROMCU